MSTQRSRPAVPKNIQEWVIWWHALSNLSSTDLVSNMLLSYAFIKKYTKDKKKEPVQNHLPLQAFEALAQEDIRISPVMAYTLLIYPPEYLCIDKNKPEVLYDVAFKLFSQNHQKLSKLPNLSWSPNMLYDVYGSSMPSQQDKVKTLSLILEYAVALFHEQNNKDQLAMPAFHEWGQKYKVATRPYVALLQSMYNNTDTSWADALKTTFYFVQGANPVSLDYIEALQP